MIASESVMVRRGRQVVHSKQMFRDLHFYTSKVVTSISNCDLLIGFCWIMFAGYNMGYALDVTAGSLRPTDQRCLINVIPFKLG